MASWIFRIPRTPRSAPLVLEAVDRISPGEEPLHVAVPPCPEKGYPDRWSFSGKHMGKNRINWILGCSSFSDKHKYYQINVKLVIHKNAAEARFNPIRRQM